MIRSVTIRPRHEKADEERRENLNFLVHARRVILCQDAERTSCLGKPEGDARCTAFLGILLFRCAAMPR
jgi:hypothetical protein